MIKMKVGGTNWSIHQKLATGATVLSQNKLTVALIASYAGLHFPRSFSIDSATKLRYAVTCSLISSTVSSIPSLTRVRSLLLTWALGCFSERFVFCGNFRRSAICNLSTKWWTNGMGILRIGFDWATFVIIPGRSKTKLESTILLILLTSYTVFK